MRIRDGYTLSLVGNDYFMVDAGMDVSDNIHAISDIAAQVLEYVMDREFSVSTIAKFLTNDHPSLVKKVLLLCQQRIYVF